MLPATLHLEIVSPEKLLVAGNVDFVTVPGKDGYLGILPGHAPLLSKLGIGIIQFTRGQQKDCFSCCRGFVEVLPESVSILAEISENPKDIDANRAQQAKKRAEDLLWSRRPDVDYERAQLALRRAITRLWVAEHRHGG